MQERLTDKQVADVKLWAARLRGVQGLRDQPWYLEFFDWCVKSENWVFDPKYDQHINELIDELRAAEQDSHSNT